MPIQASLIQLVVEPKDHVLALSEEELPQIDMQNMTTLLLHFADKELAATLKEHGLAILLPEFGAQAEILVDTAAGLRIYMEVNVIVLRGGHVGRS